MDWLFYYEPFTCESIESVNGMFDVNVKRRCLLVCYAQIFLPLSQTPPTENSRNAYTEKDFPHVLIHCFTLSSIVYIIRRFTSKSFFTFTFNNLHRSPTLEPRERERERLENFFIVCVARFFPWFSFTALYYYTFFSHFHPHHEKSTKQKLVIRISLARTFNPIRCAAHVERETVLTCKEKFILF